MAGGHWLLLEDIDSATSDVIAVLAGLLENGAINVPGYRDNLRAAPGFQLFLTYRYGDSSILIVVLICIFFYLTFSTSTV